MKKNFLFLKKYLFLTALLCLGIVRSAAQEAAPTVESGWRAELGLFYAGASYEQRVASRFSLVGHFDLHPEWGRMVYDNPNMKFGGFVPTFQLEGRWYYSVVRPGNSGGYLALRSDLAWNNARLFAAAKYDDYNVVSCSLNAGWGYNLSLGKQWTAFSYIGLGLPKWKFYRSPFVDGWERERNLNLVLDLGIGYRL